MGHFPPNFRSPLAPKLLVGHNVKVGSKMYGQLDMLYPHAKFGGDLPPHRSERGKMGVFCLFLFVCHAYGLCISGL